MAIASLFCWFTIVVLAARYSATTACLHAAIAQGRGVAVGMLPGQLPQRDWLDSGGFN